MLSILSWLWGEEKVMLLRAEDSYCSKAATVHMLVVFCPTVWPF